MEDPATQEPREPGTLSERAQWPILVIAAVVLAAAVAAGFTLFGGDHDEPIVPVTAEFGGSEGHPCCVYVPKDKAVDAQVNINGNTAPGDRVTVMVTLTTYADENKEFLIGTTHVSVQVTGKVHLPLHIAIPAPKPPQIDDDGIAIVAIETTYRHSKKA